MSSTAGNSFFFEIRGKQDILFPLGADIKSFVLYSEAKCRKQAKNKR